MSPSKIRIESAPLDQVSPLRKLLKDMLAYKGRREGESQQDFWSRIADENGLFATFTIELGRIKFVLRSYDMVEKEMEDFARKYGVTTLIKTEKIGDRYKATFQRLES